MRPVADPLAFVPVLHWACAVAYALLAIAAVARMRSAPNARLLAAAITGAWAAAVAVSWPNLPPRAEAVADAVRLAAWGAVLVGFYRSARPDRRQRAWMRGTIAAIAAVAAALAAGRIAAYGGDVDPVAAVAVALAIAIALSGVLLIENVWRNTEAARRWHVTPVCVALGGMFAYEIVLVADSMLFGAVSPILFAGRALAAAMLVPLLLLHAARNRRDGLFALSRTAAFHSATLMICGIFFLSLSLVGETLRAFGSAWGGVAE